MKTLEDAIGCWTVSDEGLRRLAKMIVITTQRCCNMTRHNPPDKLMKELILLDAQLDTMRQMTGDAIRRLHTIIETQELEKDNA